MVEPIPGRFRVLIAQLSDSHITTGPLAAAPAEGLYRALGRVLTLEPWPDCVVLTGDLVDSGSPAEYAALRQVIGRFPLPLHLVVGNHDDPAALLAEFGEQKAPYYRVDYPRASLLVLDSHVAGSAAGRIGGEQLSWLAAELATRTDVPALVCLHHPPVELGIPFMDGIGLADADELAGVVSRFPHVVRVLAGHVHRSVTAGFAGTTMTTAPSTYRQIDLCTRAEAPFGYVHEPTGFLLHRLTDAGCVTHLVQVSHAAAPVQGY